MSSDKEISKIGLGTFPFSGVFSDVDQSKAEEIVQQFFDLGGTYIETAPVYPIKAVALGDIIKQFPSDSFYIATKCVTGADAEGNKMRSGELDFLKYQCESEIKRLGVGALDLVQAHFIPDDVPINVLGENLDYIKKNFCKEIGVSNVNFDQLSELSEFVKIDYIQNRFSIIHQSEHRSIEAFCEKNDIKFNPYQVIERGQLTTVSSEPDWSDSDLRKKKHEYVGEPFYFIRNWVNTELKKIADDNGVDVESIVIPWTLKQPQVEVCVIGATSSMQVKKILDASKNTLSDDVISKIDSAYLLLRNQISDKFGISLEEFRGLS